MIPRFVKQCPAHYGSQKFFILPTRVRHWCPSWCKWTHSTPFHPVCLRVILMLSSHIRLGVHSSLFLRFSHQFLRVFLFFHMCDTSSQFHSPWFIHLNEFVSCACRRQRSLKWVIGFHQPNRAEWVELRHAMERSEDMNYRIQTMCFTFCGPMFCDHMPSLWSVVDLHHKYTSSCTWNLLQLRQSDYSACVLICLHCVKELAGAIHICSFAYNSHFLINVSI
jgi:ABC-type transporter Mla MlaB component